MEVRGRSNSIIVVVLLALVSVTLIVLSEGIDKDTDLLWVGLLIFLGMLMGGCLGLLAYRMCAKR